MNLDVDGVLADEDQFLKTVKVDAEQMGHAFYMERLPLCQEDLSRYLSGWDVQIVSKRPAWAEATTTVWLQAHYPWLIPYVRALVCVGAKGSKVRRVERPHAAIDDSASSIAEYLEHKIPVIGITSSRSDWCPGSAVFAYVKFVPTLAEALALLQEVR